MKTLRTILVLVCILTCAGFTGCCCCQTTGRWHGNCNCGTSEVTHADCTTTCPQP
jgi:hypothetical protein